MPYLVIEFEDGGLAVVSSNWVTPRKREVYWPPVKESKNFEKLLKRNEEVVVDTWKLHPIQRIFCETGY